MIDTIAEGLTRDIKQSAPPQTEVDIDRLTRERDRYLRRKWISDEEVEQITLDLEESPLLDATFARFLRRMSRETEVFDQYQDEDLRFGVKAARAVDEFKGTPVDWDAKDVLGDMAGGAYDPYKDWIVLAGPPARKSEIIREIAISGSLPKKSHHFVHEGTHRIHAKPGPIEKAWESIRHWGDPPMRHMELKEVHAHRASDFPVHKVSQAELVDFILENYKDADPDKVRYAVHAIDTMYALGYSDQDIEKYTKDPEIWDPKRKIYTRIHNSLRYVVKSKGLTAPEIENLIELHKLKLEVQSLKARAIAQDELIKYKEAA